MRDIKLRNKDKNRLESFIKKNHTMVTEYNKKSKIFLISFPQLPECIAKGKTVKEALKNVESAKWTWGVACILNEHDLPEPKYKRMNEQYVFVRVTDDELYEINAKAWETRKSPDKFIRSLIVELIPTLVAEIEPYQDRLSRDICEDVEVESQQGKLVITKRADVSQVVFAG